MLLRGTMSTNDILHPFLINRKNVALVLLSLNKGECKAAPRTPGGWLVLRLHFQLTRQACSGVCT